MSRRIWATRIHASAEAIERSKSLARRRHRPSQAKVRSTTQRRGRTSNPFALSDRLTISSTKRPDLLELALQFWTRIAAVGENVAQPRPTLQDRLQNGRRAVAILDAGTVDDEADHQPGGVGNDVALAAIDLLARVKPPDSAAFRRLHRLASLVAARDARSF